MLQSLINYLKLMRFHRLIGTFLLLWPTLWALVLANQHKLNIKIIFIFILGVIVMRAAGCVINDIVDKNFDGKVARTKDRPLASQAVTVKEALIIFLLLCLFALSLVIQLNSFTVKLSCIGLLLAVIYPFTKRITYWPQLVLGAAFAWSIPMVFAAQYQIIPFVAWLLYIAAILWPLAYDTQYAMVDREDDVKIGIKSTAILFGKQANNIIMVIQIGFLTILTIIGLYLKLNFTYYLCLLLAMSLFIYQYYLVKSSDPKNYFKAFLNNNWVGLIIFVGFILGILI